MQITKRLVWDVIALDITGVGFWYQLSVHRSQPSSILTFAGMVCAGGIDRNALAGSRHCD